MRKVITCQPASLPLRQRHTHTNTQISLFHLMVSAGSYGGGVGVSQTVTNMKQVSQKWLCGPPRTTGLKLFLKYSNFAICFLNNQLRHGIELLFLSQLNKHKNKNLCETYEIYCPKLASHTALKCDKSCKLQVKGLFCKECEPTLKLGIPVRVRKWPDPAGTRARGEPPCCREARDAPSPVYWPQKSICFPSSVSLPQAMPVIRVRCLCRSLVQLSWESQRRPYGLFKLKVSSVCLRCLKIFGKLPLVVLVTAQPSSTIFLYCIIITEYLTVYFLMDEFPNQLVSISSNITVLVTKTMLVLTTGLVPFQRQDTRVHGKSHAFITTKRVRKKTVVNGALSLAFPPASPLHLPSLSNPCNSANIGTTAHSHSHQSSKWSFNIYEATYMKNSLRNTLK